jgi:hypothetical protein
MTSSTYPREGRVRKGGKNLAKSQVRTRPPAPEPLSLRLKSRKTTADTQQAQEK